MAMEIPLDLGLALPGQELPGQRQAQHLLAVEVAEEVDDEVAEQDPGEARRQAPAATTSCRSCERTAARMIGASSGTGQAQAAEHQEQRDPQVAELSDQCFRQPRLPAARPGAPRARSRQWIGIITPPDRRGAMLRPASSPLAATPSRAEIDPPWAVADVATCGLSDRRPRLPGRVTASDRRSVAASRPMHPRQDAQRTRRRRSREPSSQGGEVPMSSHDRRAAGPPPRRGAVRSSFDSNRSRAGNCSRRPSPARPGRVRLRPRRTTSTGATRSTPSATILNQGNGPATGAFNVGHLRLDHADLGTGSVPLGEVDRSRAAWLRARPATVRPGLQPAADGRSRATQRAARSTSRSGSTPRSRSPRATTTTTSGSARATTRRRSPSPRPAVEPGRQLAGGLPRPGHLGPDDHRDGAGPQQRPGRRPGRPAPGSS